MNRKILLFLVLLLGVFIGVVYATTFSYTYDTATPQGSDDPAEADDRMREIKLAVQERMDVDHFWELTGTEVSDADAGEHRKILFHVPIAATPTVAADHGDLRIKDVNSIAELHWTDESERELQLTSLGNNLPHNTWLTASDVAGTGSVNLILADHNDVAVIPDNSQTVTNAAPTSTTGIANKKYVDDSTKGDIVTLNDSEPTAMLKAQAYLAQTSGFVSAYKEASQYTLAGYVGTTTDPVGDGVMVARSKGNDTTQGTPYIYFFVPNGKYFEITMSTHTPTITWTPLVSGGGAPIDQD